MKKIFISYKRDDSPVMAGRLCDNLQNRFSKKQVFYDIITLSPGDEFEALIKDYILKSEILLAVIGPNWLESIQAKTDKVNDFVTFEITTALQNNLKVIPVLLEDTKMPSADQLPANLQGLTKKNAFTLHNTSFNTEIDILSIYIRKYLNERKNYGKLLKYTLFSVAACLAVLVTYFLWPKKEIETRSGYREITQINSQEEQISMNWSTVQFVITKPRRPASMPLKNNAILFIYKQDQNDLVGFFFLVKPSTPASLFFHQAENKLFINQKLKALLISGKEKIPPLTNAEIADLETVSIASEDLSDTLFNQLSEILQVNPHISVIDNLALASEKSLPQISESVYQLMKMTTPEILVCPTSFQEIATLNLTTVKSAIIRGGSNTAPNFYRSLALPALKSLASYKAETSKIVLGNTTESITYFDDSTFKNLGSLTNRAQIKQLQLVFSEKSTTNAIDFGPIKEYKNLKSFGYYDRSESNNSDVINIGSIEGMTDITISKVRVADLSLLAKKNPALQQLTVSFNGGITNLDWASAFTHLKSLSLDIQSDSLFRDYRNVQALSKLPELEYFAINGEIARDSKQYQNLLSACPKCNIYRWGLCLGSGWLLIFFPVIGLLLIVKRRQTKLGSNPLACK